MNDFYCILGPDVSGVEIVTSYRLIPDSFQLAYLRLAVSTSDDELVVDGLREDQVGHRHGALLGKYFNGRLVDKDVQRHGLTTDTEWSLNGRYGEGAIGLSGVTSAVGRQHSFLGVDVEAEPFVACVH